MLQIEFGVPHLCIVGSSYSLSSSCRFWSSGDQKERRSNENSTGHQVGDTGPNGLEGVGFAAFLRIKAFAEPGGWVLTREMSGVGKNQF